MSEQIEQDVTEITIDQAEASRLAKDAIKLISLERIPATKRSKVDQNFIDETIRKLAGNFKEVFEELTKQERSLLIFGVGMDAKESFNHWQETLESPQTQPRVLKSGNLTTDEINNAFCHNTSAYTTVYGGIEELQPLVATYEMLLRRLKSIANGLCSVKAEWQSDSTFELVIDSEIIRQYANYKEIVTRLEIRAKTLERNINTASRFMGVVDTWKETSKDSKPKGSLWGKNKST